MSDLHLELGQQYHKFDIPPRAPYLILAGDIGRLADYTPLRDFLFARCEQFTHVFLVLGNHEFFGVSRPEGLRLAEKLENEPRLKQKLSILNRRRVDLQGDAPVTILGCTLQSHVPLEAQAVVEQKVNDFRRIVDWKVADHVAEHKMDSGWLRDEITAIRNGEHGSKRRIVVVTHHAPSTRGTSKPSDEDSPWASAFGTDLLGTDQGSCLDDVQWWISGHTHYSTEFSIGTVKLVSNQRGYVFPSNAEDTGRSARAPRSLLQRIWGSPYSGTDSFDVGKVIHV
ncbi:MAG: hypothetical protein M1832_006375 [Thelocarpon impressellum]|nr:MAG: hypothetical protein M1832_006375 [Thelocarpon impressellum]